jgi:hypothetical protein
MSFAVILWWGRELRLLRGESDAAARSLAEGESPVDAIVELLSEGTQAPVRIRLVYHPEALEEILPQLIAQLARRDVGIEGAWRLRPLLEDPDVDFESMAGSFFPGVLERVRKLQPGQGSDFTARRPAWRNRLFGPESARFRRRLGLAGGLLILAGIVALTAGLWRRQAFWRRQSEDADEQRARLERLLESRGSDRELRERLEGALRLCERPPQHQSELLETLAAEIPRALTLTSVTCEEGRFTIRGRIDDATGDPLPSFCQNLAAGDPPWRIEEPGGSPAKPQVSASQFVIRGVFADPDRLKTAGAGIPPESLSALEARWSAARARLSASDAFETWLKTSAGRWIVELRSTESSPDFGMRHYALDYRNPALDAWADILRTAQILCAEPALTIDRLDLEAAPEGADTFRRVEIALTARVLP